MRLIWTRHYPQESSACGHRQCEPIRIRWWYGWGIHVTPCGWLYNVSGFDAVAITLRDGRKFALGTDDPQELTAGIRDAIRVN
jgi:hypothetical protein